MNEEEYKKFVVERFERYLRELGFKTTEEIDGEILEGMICRTFAPLEERAKQLKQAGIGIDDIAICLGVHRITLIRMRNPEAKERYNAYMREYMRAYRARKKQGN